MDSSFIGHILLIAALIGAVWAAASPVAGRLLRDSRFALSGMRALISSAILLTAGVLLLVIALYSRDFGLEYVASYSSRSTSRLFTFTALWAGMEGSLLLWTAMTAVYGATAAAAQFRRRRDLAVPATSVLGAIVAAFAGLLVFAADPFRPLSPIPLDGAGLNPLLQSPFMAIHPVLLYLGLTGFAVPFAFAMASLVVGKLDFRWFVATRRWTVLTWSFLTAGIILGAGWAYHELGWGGYWAWDPVENASLLPWLTGTAFLHSVLIQERRGMLKVWNVALILSTYALSVFGTFLTRSGLLESVHTFSESPVGRYLLPVLAVILITAFGLLGLRVGRLQSERRLDSLVSREAMFLFNNLLLVTLAFAVLWGTLYPVVVEAIRGVRISVRAPFFNAIAVPIGLALLALTGIGPLVAWRRASPSSLLRHFAMPLVVGSATVLALALGGIRHAASLTAFGLCAFVVAAIAGEFSRAARAHSSSAGGVWRGLLSAVGRNRRRYGGYIVHLGVVLIFIGLGGAAFKQTWTGVLRPGGAFEIGEYEVTYQEARRFSTEEKMVAMAVMRVEKGGRLVATLTPQRNFHLAQNQPQSEIGLRTTLAEDLYLVLTRMDEAGAATVRAWVNPLVMWIWLGGAVMVAGMAVILTAKPPALPVSAPTAMPARDKEAVLG